MRCEQAKTLMGEPSTHTRTDKTRQNHEYVYFHHTDTVSKGNACTWGNKSEVYYRKVKTGMWFIPPFSPQEQWACMHGKLDYLRPAIPYGVVLRLNELKKLKLFNSFSVIAPVEAFKNETDLDPIVLGEIWTLSGTNSTGNRIL